MLGEGLRPRRNRRPKVSRDLGDLRSAGWLGQRPATAHCGEIISCGLPNMAWRERVAQRARYRCEYCHLPEQWTSLPFQLDPIIAGKHEGPTSFDNLAFACLHCNAFKGPNIAGRDAQTQQTVRLFHPRQDVGAHGVAPRHVAPHLVWVPGIEPMIAQPPRLCHLCQAFA